MNENRPYRIVSATRKIFSDAIEDLETEANKAAKSGGGYFLDPNSISWKVEDLGPHQVPLYHVTAVLMDETEIRLKLQTMMKTAVRTIQDENYRISVDEPDDGFDDLDDPNICPGSPFSN